MMADSCMARALGDMMRYRARRLRGTEEIRTGLLDRLIQGQRKIGQSDRLCGRCRRVKVQKVVRNVKSEGPEPHQASPTALLTVC